MTHKFTEVLHGITISGESLNISILESLHGVKRVTHDSKKKITKYGDGTSLAWGLDRLDSKKGLDGVYNHQYSGDNVDVYIVDTGIDTSHNEFQPLPGRPTRQVKNVYSAFTSDLKADIDGQGHGTHVAATVGGKFVGVAPNANILGVQVLSTEGEGSTSDIVHGLEFVLTYAQNRGGARSVVSMSLGGPCDSADCKDDSLVIASEYLISKGIIVVVASGNDACNACKGSPNAAPSAINVGAIDQHDEIAYFSNYGQCIDVFSPGVDIISACAHSLCPDENYYIPLSGTSMATPHVRYAICHRISLKLNIIIIIIIIIISGVVAQLLQKDNTATINDIIRSIGCDGSTSTVKLYSKDTISKNLVLQVPKTDDNVDCNLGLGCMSDCSSNGICLPVHNSNNASCFCNGGYYGPTCSYNSDPYCVNRKNLTANFYDFASDGWDYSTWSVSDSTGSIVDGALDSLCSTSMESHDYCIPPGCYNLDVSRGKFPEEIAWEFCDMQGSAPFTGKFCVNGLGQCKQTCNGAFTNITLFDTYGDGWGGSYYGIYNQQGKQLFGGSLPDDQEWNYEICLPANSCSTVLIETNDEDPDEVFYEICGYVASYHEVVTLCVDNNHNCTASTGSASNNSCLSGSASNNIPIYLFDREVNGWNGQMYTITNESGEKLVDITLESNFSSVYSACLPDGCYDLEVGSTSLSQPNEFWSTCGFRGTVPWKSKICLEQKYNLCYGVSGCYYFKSYMHESDLQRYFIYDPSTYNQVVDLDNIHGVHDMCSLPDGTYDIFVGAGKSMSGPNEVEICNQKVSIPSITTISSFNNGTTCSIQKHKDLSCATGGSHKVTISIVMIDTFGDGWSDGLGKFIIKDASNNIVSQGSLQDGFLGIATSCLQIGFSYKLSVSARQYGDEIAIVMCGAVKSLISNAYFLVTATGCTFADSDDDKYFIIDDDDFPRILTPTLAPSVQPSQSVVTKTPVPTLIPTLAPSASVQVVSIAMNITTMLSFFNNDQVLAVNDFYFLILGIRRILDLNGYAVWSIELNSMTVKYSNDGNKVVIKALNFNRRLSSTALVMTAVTIKYYVSKDQYVDSNVLTTSASTIVKYLEGDEFQNSIDTVLSATVTMTEIKRAEVVKIDNSNQPFVQTLNLSSQPANEYENIYDKIWPEDMVSNKKENKFPIYATAIIVVFSCLLLFFTCYYVHRKKKRIAVAKYTSLGKSGSITDDSAERGTSSSSEEKPKTKSKIAAKLRPKAAGSEVKFTTTESSNPLHNSYVPVSIQVTDTDDLADI